MTVLSPEKHICKSPAEEICFTALFTASAELLVLLDAKLRPIKVNPAFLEHSGYPAGTMPGLHLDDFFDQSTASRMQQALGQEAVLATALDQEALLRARDGSQHPVRLRTHSFIPETGAPLHLLLCTDLSGREELLAQMREDRRQLRRSSRLASLGEMVAGIGHELTQPLNAILLFARNCLKMLDHSPQNETMLRENLEIIVDRANRASSTIHIMRSFARLEKEEGRQPVEINALLEKILNFLTPQLRLSEIELKLDLSDQPCVVNGLEVSLEQVFLNLIQNAIQAMGRVESPRLIIATCRSERLEVKTMLKESYVIVTIADNGEGMSEEVRKKIFDPFFTTREAGIGTGLGLSIVDRIIRGFAGSISVESTEDRGSVFTVCLPRRQDEEDNKPQ